MGWTRYTTAGGAGRNRPTATVELGPGDVAGLDRRLIGAFEGQRILELGTGAGHSAIAMATGGARVVAIDSDPEQVVATRAAIDASEQHVELHDGDLAALAFLQADSFDAVVSVHALAAVSDLGRVFRQVHRVLKPDRPIIFTLPHPAALALDTEDSTALTGRYDDAEPLGEGSNLTHRHTVGSVFTQLHRANFRVDAVVEPMGAGPLPESLVIRARKLGI